MGYLGSDPLSRANPTELNIKQDKANPTSTGTMTHTGNTAVGDSESLDSHAIKGATTVLVNSASPALKVTQTGSGNAFVVEDSASTDATPFVIDASGAVGIGIAPTIGNFEVSASNNSIPAILGNAGGTSAYVVLRNSVATDNRTRIGAESNDMTFSTNTIERMRIDSAGNIGVGRAAYSDVRLLAKGADATTQYAFQALNSTDAVLFSVKNNGDVLVASTSRNAPLVDNDLSFDLTSKNNFTCIPTASGTLTFTNIASAAGQSGTIILVNGSSYTISKAATTKSDSAFSSAVSATGTYRISYYCDGTNVYCTTSGAMV